MGYEVRPDGTLKNGKVFFNWNFTEDDEALDGMKINKKVTSLFLPLEVFGYFLRMQNYYARL